MNQLDIAGSYMRGLQGPQQPLGNALAGMAQPQAQRQYNALAAFGGPTQAAADSMEADPQAIDIAGSALGLNETTKKAALQEFLANGGQNLDPATTAWCAAFVDATLAQAGKQGTGKLNARSYLDWGRLPARLTQFSNTRQGATMATLLNPFLRADDANGDPVSGGQLAIFEAGTTTPVTTYSDRALTTAQARPLIANAAGEFEQSFVESGIYKIRVSGADGVTLYENDNVRIADRLDDPIFLDDVAAVYDDTETYVENTIIGAFSEGLKFKAAASGASDHDFTNAGGQKLYILPAEGGAYDVRSWNIDTTGTDDAATTLEDAILKCATENKNLVVSGTLRCSSTINFPSGTSNAPYHVDFKNAKLKPDAGVTPAVSIGSVGSNPYRGIIEGLWVVRDTYAGSDVGISLVNCSEAQIINARVENFSKAYAFLPVSTSRVANTMLLNPYAQGHEYGIFMQSASGGSNFVNENSVIGGRFLANVSGRLIDQIHLDNTGGVGVGHNRFIAVNCEGFSGGGSCGRSAFRCINGADQNVFEYCRGEKYNDGWDDATYYFDATSNNNRWSDTRIDNTFTDLAGDNAFFDTTKGYFGSDVPGGNTHPAFRYKRQAQITDDDEKFAIDIEDVFSASGKVGLLKYVSPRVESRAGTLISLTTGYNEIFKMDDAGTILPRNNFADLGGSSNRYREIYGIKVIIGNGGQFITTGNGSPEGVVTATPGSIYTSTAGGTGTTLYVKETGTGNTGWVAK